jgi:hypothetical protein
MKKESANNMSEVIVVYQADKNEDKARPTLPSELVKKGVRRVISEYGEVLRKLADE